MKPEQERIELLEAVKNLAALIEQSRDISKIYEYIDQLNELRAKLVALGPAKKANKATNSAT